MNTSDFTSTILASLRNLRQVASVDLHTEGPVVKGRPLFDGGIFLAFYFNQITATQAFALIKGTDRIWGIDFDTFRGWHLHPVEKPQDHVTIQAQDIPTIIEKLGNVIATLTTK